MDLKELYETNADFRGYVDRYAKHNGISTEEALEHAMGGSLPRKEKRMGNYNVGDKFVIEIGRVCGCAEVNIIAKPHTVYGVKGDNTFTLDEQRLDNLERLDGDYVNENFGELQNEAYNAGLNDAWELAKKIVLSAEKGGLKYDDLKKAFGVGDYYSVLEKLTPQEALAKLEAYEKSKAEIKVWDVVKDKDSDMEWVVIATSDETFSRQTILRSLEEKSRIMYSSNSDLIKIGKHIGISAILAEIGKE